MKKTCNDIAPMLSALVDEELDNEKRHAVEEHIAGCPDCKSSFAAERQMKKLVVSHYRTERTPPHLRARIRREIAGERVRPGFLDLLADAFTLYKVKGAMAIAAVLVIALLPYLSVFQAGSSSPLLTMGNGSFKAAGVQKIEGQVICIDCELLKKAALSVTHDASHRKGLRDAGGRVWNFLYSEQGKQLLHEESLLQKHLEIEGLVFPEQGYVSVRSFRKI